MLKAMWTKYFLVILAVLALALFVLLWVDILVAVAAYPAKMTPPELPYPEPLATLATALGASFAAVTATALGFKVAEIKGSVRVFAAAGPNPSTPTAQVDPLAATQVDLVATSGGVLAAAASDLSAEVKLAIIAIFGVGIAVLLTWAANPSETPQFVQAFGLVVVGWVVGLVGVLFKTGSD